MNTTTSGTRTVFSSGATYVARRLFGGNVGRSATMRAAASAFTSLWNSTYISPVASFSGTPVMPKMDVPSGQECRCGGMRMLAPRRAAIMAWQKRRFSGGRGTSGRSSSLSMRLTATGCQRKPSFSMTTRCHSAYCSRRSRAMGSARGSSAKGSYVASPVASTKSARCGQLPEQVVHPTQSSMRAAKGRPSSSASSTSHGQNAMHSPHFTHRSGSFVIL